MKKIWVLILGFLSIVYLINPTAGIFEFLPDNIPFIGNVDEGLAAFRSIQLHRILARKADWNVQGWAR